MFAGMVAALVLSSSLVSVYPDTTALHHQVQAGTLLQSHGVVATCDVCNSEVVTVAQGSTTPLATVVPVGYSAAELAAAYHLPAASAGTAGTVALIDGGGYPGFESDLATYRSQFGLPPCKVADGCLKVVDYKGGPPLHPDGTDQEKELSLETALDAEMISAACPACKIVLVQAPAEDFYLSALHPSSAAVPSIAKAVDTAIRSGASAVSMSFGYPSTKDINTGAVSAVFSHPGIAFVASSGDSGYHGNVHGYWPQNLPTVISAGGTALYQTSDGFVSNAWNQAGSACETDLPPAHGQPSAVAALCSGHRASSDVSAVSDPATGVAVYDSYGIGGWYIAGGTSAAAPFIAALYARAGHTSRVDGPNTLYTAPDGAFTDVSLGQNGAAHSCQTIAPQLCVAGKGWDGPTGVGTPNGLAGF
ncbi:S8 family serine peptidase [Kutzneria kofuensis]|uniref:Subtilase family serine protease n=1 Tax=Kutzneria kofuensis TaxID=103725 RepID=A0A7W9NF46_9PSEU|nr:S8 family serine peptidase [Kutzneria kofuensis]MBB5889628.1 subtilase family serine protease [Kutzneria kofuensis]